MITIKAPAKINLSLDVINKREDGYHNLKMIMAEIPLYDIVNIERIQKNDIIKVKTNLSYLPENNKNTTYMIAEAFFKYTKISGGISINIKKNIPVSAGLAGGSTDAAAVLKGLNQLYNTNLSCGEMEEIGDTVGKDIPFCLKGGICLAEGTGKILTPLGSLPKCYMVLIKPSRINVSTKAVFSALDVSKIELHPDTSGIIKAIEKNSLSGISRRLYNVLEDVTTKLHPKINELKTLFIEKGALGSVMSGSGPSVFGIFNSKEKAESAFNFFKSIDRQTFLLEI